MFGQLHHDDEIAADQFNPLQRQKVWMVDRLDMLKGAKLLGGSAGIICDLTTLAGDEFECLDKAAWRFAFPDLAEAALTEWFEEAIAWQRFSIGLMDRHYPSEPSALRGRPNQAAPACAMSTGRRSDSIDVSPELRVPLEGSVVHIS